MGAGTSGRLGVLDSVELHPTFNWPPERAPALLAGGHGAMFVAVEGAEDSREQGAADLLALAPTALDVVLLLAASGGTPYALGAAAAARAAGALTVGLVNNPGAPLAAACDTDLLSASMARPGALTSDWPAKVRNPRIASQAPMRLAGSCGVAWRTRGMTSMWTLSSCCAMPTAVLASSSALTAYALSTRGVG